MKILGNQTLLHCIRQQQFPEPKKLVSFLQAFYVEEYGAATIYAQEINEWCHTRGAVPSDVDETFVLAFITCSLKR